MVYFIFKLLNIQGTGGFASFLDDNILISIRNCVFKNLSSGVVGNFYLKNIFQNCLFIQDGGLIYFRSNNSVIRIMFLTLINSVARRV